jgi:hypothetical protein
LRLTGLGAAYVRRALEQQGNGVGGLHRDGKVTIVLALVAAFAGLWRGVGRGGRGPAIGAIVLGGLVTLIGVVDVGDVGSAGTNPVFDRAAVQIHPGIGLWLTLIGGLLLVAAGVHALLRR